MSILMGGRGAYARRVCPLVETCATFYWSPQGRSQHRPPSFYSEHSSPLALGELRLLQSRPKEKIQLNYAIQFERRFGKRLTLGTWGERIFSGPCRSA